MKNIVNKFGTVSLNELKKVQLLRRFDTKYFLHIDNLDSILEEMRNNYKILKIKDILTQSYKTYYYDDKDQSSYIKHHNGKKNREKVRFREYLDVNDIYLEIKHKNNKGITVKKRLKTLREKILSQKQKDFIVRNSNFKPDNIFLENINSFNRMTFVDNNFSHRLTIDNNFSFFYKKEKFSMGDLVIIEVKESRGNIRSLIKDILKNNKIQKNRISKYCLSTFLLNKNIKSNNFKRTLLKLNKLNILN
tara:strand:- start:2264 stop:3007 length:744 start_codon:yes stop_codon:yes gene_type:complete